MRGFGLLEAFISHENTDINTLSCISIFTECLSFLINKGLYEDIAPHLLCAILFKYVQPFWWTLHCSLVRVSHFIFHKIGIVRANSYQKSEGISRWKAQIITRKFYWYISTITDVSQLEESKICEYTIKRQFWVKSTRGRNRKLGGWRENRKQVIWG